MDPRHCEADNFMEQLGFLAEAFQMIDCLLDETLGLAARAIPAEQRVKCRFLLHAIFADPLSQKRVSVSRIQQIVSDLEPEPGAGRVPARVGARLWGRAPNEGARLDAPAE